MKRKVELILFNHSQAAKYLGVDRNYINTLIEHGELTEIQLPFRSTMKGRRIPKKVLDEFIDRSMKQVTEYREGIDHLLAKYGIVNK